MNLEMKIYIETEPQMELCITEVDQEVNLENQDRDKDIEASQVRQDMWEEEVYSETIVLKKDSGTDQGVEDTGEMKVTRKWEK